MGNLNRRRAAFRDDDSFLSRATPQRFTAEEYVAYWHKRTCRRSHRMSAIEG